MQKTTLGHKAWIGPRRVGTLAGGLALTLAALGAAAVVAAGPASAFSAVQTQGYTITGAAATVSSVTASVSPNTAPGTGNYTLTLVTPSVLNPSTTPGSASSLSIVDADPSEYNGIVAGVTGAGVGVVDTSAGYAFTATVGNGFLSSVPATGSLAAAEADPLVVRLGGSATIPAGSTLMLTFVASNPVAGSYNFLVATSSSPTFVEATTPLTLVAGALTPTVTAVPLSVGTGATYTLTSITVPASTTTLTLQACTGAKPVAVCTPAAPSLNSGTGNVAFSSTAASYTVTDASTAAVLPVASTEPVNIAPGATRSGGVALVLSSAPTVGHELTITADAENPATPEADWFVVGFAGAVVVTNSVSFGASVGNVSVAVSNTQASSTGTYALTFDVSSTGGMSSGTITLRGPAGTVFANPSGGLVTDSTTGATQVVSGLVPATTVTANDTLVITTNFAVADGNAMSLTVFGVTNPVAGSYSGISGFSVHTTADPTPAYNATPYVIGSATTSGTGPTVTVVPNTAGMLATYTVGQLRAADPLVGGTDTIEVTGPVGTQFPNTATLEDATTPSASQTLTLRQGLASNDIVYNLTANVAAGDVVTLVMTGVINPAGTPVGSTDTLVLGADNATSNTTAAGLQGLATVVSTPTTTTTAPTTTTTPVLHAVVAATTAKATVLGKTVKLQLRCSVASCQGLITLTDVRTVVATAKYSLAVGKTGTVSVTLDSQGLQFLAHAPSHSLTLRESVTVTGGTTAQRKITVSAPAVPVIAALTAEATVAAKTVKLELRCTVARCQGVITLTDVRTLLAAATYSLAAGKTGTVPVTLGSQGLQLLGHAPGHILKLNETVTVTGGTTVRNKITVAG